MLSEIGFRTNIIIQINTQGLKNINNTFISVLPQSFSRVYYAKQDFSAHIRALHNSRNLEQ